MFKLSAIDIARIERAVNLSLETTHAHAAGQIRCTKPGIVAVFYGLREIGVTVPPHKGNKHRAAEIRRGEKCPTQSSRLSKS